MSELEKVRKIVRKMRLTKDAARQQARQAFRKDLGAGRPDLALQCAKEFMLGNEYITEAASTLFVTLVRRARFADAYRVLKNYNLLEAGPDAQFAIDLAARLDRIPSTVDLKDSDRKALRKILLQSKKIGSRRLKIRDARAPLPTMRPAARAREEDPRVKGRAVMLPGEGDLFLAGDFHGNTDALLKFVRHCDLDLNPNRIVVIQEILHARKLTDDKRDLSFMTILHCIELMLRYPGQIYYLIGNHDLGFHLGRDLVKGGKSLNRYLFKGMNFQFKERYEEVVEEYKAFIENMPAAIITQNGIFMSHSTPKRPQIEKLSQTYFTDEAAEKPWRKLKPLVALVNGRDYAPETADAFADKMGCEHMICGHTPTVKGIKVPNKRHIIIDSQHANGRYISFDLGKMYEHEELIKRVRPIFPKLVPTDDLGELMS